MTEQIQTFTLSYTATTQEGTTTFQGKSTDVIKPQPSLIQGIDQYLLDQWDNLTEEQQYQIVANRPKPIVERLNPDEVPGGKEYYASTAYRGSVKYPTERREPLECKTKGIPRIDVENNLFKNLKYGKNHSIKYSNAKPLLYCEEYLGRFNFSTSKYVRFRNKTWSLLPFQKSRYAQERNKKQSYYCYYLPDSLNSKTGRLFGGFEFILGILLLAFAYFWLTNTITAIQRQSWNYFIYHVVLYVGIYCILFYFLDICRYFFPKKDDANEYFNRRTGMQISYATNQTTKQTRTYETSFSKFYPRFVTQDGSKEFCLSNCDSVGGSLSIPTCLDIDGYLNYYLICHFMDIERPLPDIPEFEPYRYLDPVTAEHDRRTNRPPRYWRDKSYWEIRRMAKESRRRAIKILAPDS